MLIAGIRKRQTQHERIAVGERMLAIDERPARIVVTPAQTVIEVLSLETPEPAPSVFRIEEREALGGALREACARSLLP